MSGAIATPTTLFADSIEVSKPIAGQIDDISNHTTDDLPEGAENKYFTQDRARTAFSAGTGVSLNAGNIRIGQDVSSTADVTFKDLYVDSIHVEKVIGGQVSSLANHTTADLAEDPDHLYFTVQRVFEALNDTITHLLNEINDL